MAETYISNESDLMAQLLDSPAWKNFRTKDLPLKIERETRAWELLKQHQGGFTKDILNEIFDTVDTVPNSGARWFGALLATPNRNLIFQSPDKVITCWIDDLLFRGHTYRESLEICLEQQKLKGANKGLPTLLLYLSDSAHYNVWVKATERGLLTLNRIGKLKGKGVGAQYDQFNDAAIKFRNDYELQPAEIDQALWRIGSGKVETHTVQRADKAVSVTVPVETTELPATEGQEVQSEVRESIKIQALIAEIGSQMGLKIWIPKADRGGVLGEWKDGDASLLDRLPLNYDDATLKTIEQIDVLWLRGRSIIRAFEVEHTTSIYSGLLRMADLLALQPNMDIQLHIVAPTTKRDKVFQEIRRPVFSLLERGPLSELCTYLSYDALRELANEKHITHLSDTVLDEYAEEAE